jgi:hypothetical protein
VDVVSLVKIFSRTGYGNPLFRRVVRRSEELVAPVTARVTDDSFIRVTDDGSIRDTA